MSLAFSPDGSLLVSGSFDRTAVVWDVTGRHTTRPAGELTREELKAAWEALADADATKAFRAVQALAGAGPSAVAFLKECLRPAAAADPKVVEGLLKDLDSDDFATRDKATKELLALGESAEPLLRKTQNDGGLSAEARRRVESALSRLDPVSSPAVLRGPRAVEALEWIKTDEAAELLKALANGDPEARLTLEAKGSLKRLAER
jgi:hypothetical protein